METPGKLVRSRRQAKGLTQAQLARRAGTTQAAISRLEGDHVSPTMSTLRELLLVMGEAPSLTAVPTDPSIDRARLRAQRTRTPEERVALAFSWNRFAGEIARAGTRARRAGRMR